VKEIPHERVFHVDDPTLSAEVSMVPTPPKSLGLPHIRIDFSPVSPVSRPESGSRLSTQSSGIPAAFMILTPSEREVIAKVRQGLSNDEIARATQRALGTVKNQISSAYAKLQVRSRTQLLHRYGIESR
jgi:DNA-binding CsgD family transcriptional regulator